MNPIAHKWDLASGVDSSLAANRLALGVGFSRLFLEIL